MVHIRRMSLADPESHVLFDSDLKNIYTDLFGTDKFGCYLSDKVTVAFMIFKLSKSI